MEVPMKIDSWLEGFPREEVQRQINELEERLNKLQSALMLHDSLVSRDGAQTPDELGTGAELPTKPQAITTILREQPRLKAGEIREEMVRRGWLPDDTPHKKRFYATMSRLKGESRVVHLDDGRYELPPDLLKDG
jgi:hypothetical protein